MEIQTVHCHRAGDPGHGPYYRLTRKVNGKTVTETIFLTGQFGESPARGRQRVPALSGNWASNCWMSMKRSASCDQWI